MALICETVGCTTELKPNSKMTTCHLCRGSNGRWNKKRPAQRLERRRKLTMYNARMSTLKGAEDSELQAYIKEKRGG